MNNNRRIIKFEEFDFEAANNTGKYNDIASREKAEIAAMKSFNESEIKNTVSIVTRRFNTELSESYDDMVILENIFTGLYNSLKNNIKKLGDIRNAVAGKMGELKQFLASIGITKKMGPDEIAILLSKLLGNKGLIQDFNEAVEDAPKSLMTKIFSALGATSGLAGVLTYVVTTFVGIGRGSFQHGLGDKGGIISAIAIVLAILSGIAYAVSAHKDELAHKAKLRAEYAANNESRRNGKGKKVNENRAAVEDLTTLKQSLLSIQDKVFNGDDIDNTDMFVTLSHNGNEVNIMLGPDTMDSLLTLLDYAIEEEGDANFGTENTNLSDDYSDVQPIKSEDPNWNKFESKRFNRNNKRRK